MHDSHCIGCRHDAHLAGCTHDTHFTIIVVRCVAQPAKKKATNIINSAFTACSYAFAGMTTNNNDKNVRNTQVDCKFRKLNYGTPQRRP